MKRMIERAAKQKEARAMWRKKIDQNGFPEFPTESPKVSTDRIPQHSAYFLWLARRFSLIGALFLLVWRANGFKPQEKHCHWGRKRGGQKSQETTYCRCCGGGWIEKRRDNSPVSVCHGVEHPGQVVTSDMHHPSVRGDIWFITGILIFIFIIFIIFNINIDWNEFSFG